MSWVEEALQTKRVPGTAVEPDTEIPLGNAAREFVVQGAPIGEQRQTAVKVARNYWGAGYGVEEAAEALWAGLQRLNDPAREPWTWEDAWSIAQDIYTKPPSSPPQPRESCEIIFSGNETPSAPHDEGDRPERAVSAEDAGTHEDAPWEPPIPLFAEHLPAFPVESFPSWLEDFAKETATATQTPIDLPCMLSLSAVATALAKAVEVEVRPGWVEPVNIYTLTVLASGTRKSAVESEVTAPIFAHEAKLALQIAPAISNAKAKKAVLEARLKKAQAAAAKPLGDGFDINDYANCMETVIEVQRDLDGLKVPTVPRLLADDCTPERLLGLMAANGGRIGVLSAEAEIFSQAGGKYQGGATNLNGLLKGHAGDDVRVDRIGREPDYIRKPAITLGVTTQPSVLEGLAQTPGFRGMGLLGRILYSLPKATVGERDSRAAPVSSDTRQRYADLLTALLTLAHSVDETGEWAPQRLTLTPDAHEAITQFAERLEPSLAPHASLGHMADWGSKLAGAVARIAGLLHCAQVVAQGSGDPWEYAIGVETVLRAQVIGDYLLAHATAAFGRMGADEAQRSAEIVLAWIRRNGALLVTQREIFRGVSGSHFRRATDLQPALAELSERQYLRRRTAPKGQPGRPSAAYDVNPMALEGVRL